MLGGSMGTNYYTAINHCESCDRFDRDFHIGKSSYGWSFSFRGYRPERLVSWRAWKEFLKDRIIVNEYGERIDYAWFVNYIENEKSPNYYRNDNQKNLQHNEEGRKPDRWYNADFDWDDSDGYAFCSREFS